MLKLHRCLAQTIISALSESGGRLCGFSEVKPLQVRSLSLPVIGASEVGVLVRGRGGTLGECFTGPRHTSADHQRGTATAAAGEQHQQAAA